MRNEGPTPAQLSIEVRSAGGADRLAADDVEIMARTAGLDWLVIENGIAPSWLTGRAIERGGRVRVDIKVTFDSRTPNRSMLDRLPLDFEVRLVETDGSGGDKDDDDRTDLLPDTGSAVSPFVVWLGAILVGSGLALIAAARRRRREESTVADDERQHVDAGVRVHG